MTGSPWRRSAPLWTPTGRCWRRLDPTADLLAACAAERDLPQALAAIDLALWDHASRRTGTPFAKLIDPRAADRSPSTRRSAPTTAPAPPRRPRAAAARVPLREGQGRHRRRRGTARGGPGGGRAARCASAWTPTAHGRPPMRRSRTSARWRRWGSSCARSRSTASRRCGRSRRESPFPIAMDETHAPGAPAPRGRSA